jgi:hypothetical protein
MSKEYDKFGYRTESFHVKDTGRITVSITPEVVKLSFLSSNDTIVRINLSHDSFAHLKTRMKRGSLLHTNRQFRKRVNKIHEWELKNAKS